MKTTASLLLAALCALGATAQDYEVPASKHGVATNSFWANWYVSAGGEFIASYPSQGRAVGGSPFTTKRGTFGVDVAVGKWFTPGIGLRTKFQGVWAKSVVASHLHPAYNYWNIHEDVTFNLTNLLKGYDERRIWNLVPYAGVGVGRNMSANRYEITYNLGLLNNFRLSSRFSAFVDLGFMAAAGSFDAPAGDDWARFGALQGRHYDKFFTVGVGVTYHLGRHTWAKSPNVEALMQMNDEQMEALNASLGELAAENDRLRSLLEEREAPAASADTLDGERAVAAGQAAAGISVFFDVGSARPSSRRDFVNVKALAEEAKATGRRLRVTGYADSRTGSAERNDSLSRERAEVVARELVKMGVPEENVVVEAGGGVEQLSPYFYNRRVTVRLE